MCNAVPSGGRDEGRDSQGAGTGLGAPGGQGNAPACDMSLPPSRIQAKLPSAKAKAE